MLRVRIIHEWDEPRLMEQTPDGSGIWGNICFSNTPIDEYDYLIVLNRVADEVVVTCRSENIWAIVMEPPVEEFRWFYNGFDQFHRIYTPDRTFSNDNRYIPSHGALPWHVRRDYNFLKNCLPPAKEELLSWVTSSKLKRSGHHTRMLFREKLQQEVSFDLFGRGFSPLEDKWDGLAPYRYSLAIENYSGPYYWTEKIMDCFLSWTMPIYYGCTNITDYFPEEAFVRIDIEDPDVMEIINETIASDLYLKNQDAIAYARELVLDKYQLFPFLAERIKSHEENLSEIHLEQAMKYIKISPAIRETKNILNDKSIFGKLKRSIFSRKRCYK